MEKTSFRLTTIYLLMSKLILNCYSQSMIQNKANNDGYKFTFFAESIKIMVICHKHARSIQLTQDQEFGAGRTLVIIDSPPYFH